jgi:hypothetical protein
MAWDERSCARRCRNVWLLDVWIVYGNDHVELRRLLRESRNWVVIGDLPYLAWVKWEPTLIRTNDQPPRGGLFVCVSPLILQCMSPLMVRIRPPLTDCVAKVGQ